MKRFAMLVAVLASVALWGNLARADDEQKDTHRISGKSACATCDGVTKAEHQIMLVDEKGERWVLVGKGEDYDKAHKVRKDGKKMTATYKGEPKTMKDDNGKEYKQVEVTKVEVDDKEA